MSISGVYSGPGIGDTHLSREFSIQAPSSEEAMKLAGHTQVKTTYDYYNPNTDALRAAANRLEEHNKERERAING